MQKIRLCYLLHDWSWPSASLDHIDVFSLYYLLLHIWLDEIDILKNLPTKEKTWIISRKNTAGIQDSPLKENINIYVSPLITSNTFFLKKVGVKIIDTPYVNTFQFLTMALIMALSVFLKWVGGHIGRDFRPFLHTESFQIRDILCLRLWTALFNSNHRFSVGFKSGYWEGQLSTSLWILICAWSYCFAGITSYSETKFQLPGRGRVAKEGYSILLEIV